MPFTIDATIDADEKHVKMENPSVSLTDENAGQKRKRQSSTTEGGTRKKIIDEVRLLTSPSHFLIWFNSPPLQTMFHKDLQVAIKGIKELVAKGKKFLIE